MTLTPTTFDRIKLISELVLVITRWAWTLAYLAALIALGWGWEMPMRAFEYLVLTGIALAL